VTYGPDILSSYAAWTSPRPAGGASKILSVSGRLKIEPQPSWSRLSPTLVSYDDPRPQTRPQSGTILIDAWMAAVTQRSFGPPLAVGNPLTVNRYQVASHEAHWSSCATSATRSDWSKDPFPYDLDPDPIVLNHALHEWRIQTTSRKEMRSMTAGSKGELDAFLGAVYGNGLELSRTDICCPICRRCDYSTIRVMAGAIRSATGLQFNDKSELGLVERRRRLKMPGACSVRE